MRTASAAHPNSSPRPLALAVLCALGAAGVGIGLPQAAAAHNGAHPQGTKTWFVANCDDSGAGSLRGIVDNSAASGDTVDLTQLACASISLATGAIAVAQDDLTVIGPGAANLEIDAGQVSQAFIHAGQGVLSLNGLTVRNGEVHSTEASVRGGCIASEGTVGLFDTVVRDCTAHVEGDFNATGGGIYARGGIYAIHSTISGNVASASGAAQLSGFGVGGGAFTLGRGVFKYSTIDGNLAAGAGEEFKGQAGGAWVFGGAACCGRPFRTTRPALRAASCCSTRPTAIRSTSRAARSRATPPPHRTSAAASMSA